MAGQADGSVVVDTELDPKGFRAGSKDLQQAVRSLVSKVNALEPTARKAAQGSASALQAFQNRAFGIEETIGELRQRLDEFGATKFPTAQYTSLESELDKVRRKYDDLMARQERMRETGVRPSSQGWRSLQYDIEQTTARLQGLEAERRRMEENGEAFNMGAETEAFRRMRADIESAESALHGMQDQVDRGNQSFNAGDRLLGSMGSKARQLATNLARATVRSLVQGLKTAVSLSRRLAKASVNRLVSGLRRAVSLTKQLNGGTMDLDKGLKKVQKTAKKFALTLIGVRSTWMILKKAVSAYMEANEELALTQKRIWLTLGSFLGPTIERTIQGLAKVVSYFSAFLHLLGFASKSSSTAIKKTGKETKKETDKLENQLAAFDELNILSDNKSKDDDSSDQEEPPITPLPDAELPDWVKELAKLIKDGKWADAARVLSRELTKLMDSVDWAGKGEKLGKAINGPLEFLKTFAYGFPWDKLGKHLAEFVNGLMRTVNWADAGAVAVAGFYIALKTLTGFFNELDPQLFSDSLYAFIMGAVNAADWPTLTREFSEALSNFINGLDWPKLGEAFGALFGTVITSIRSFIEAFDWTELGRNLGRGLNSFIENVPWGDLGFLMVAKLYVLMHVITGFFQELDPVLVSSAIYQFIMGAITATDWPALTGEMFRAINDFIMRLDTVMLGNALGAAIQTVIASIHAALDAFNWLGIGMKLAGLINATIQQINWGELGGVLAGLLGALLLTAAGLALNIDWAQLAQSLSQFAIGLFDGITDTLRQIDWEQLGRNIVIFLENVDWSGVVQSLVTLAGTIIGSFFSFLRGVLSEAWNNFVEYMTPYVFENGEFTISGFLKGIAHGLLDIGKWIVDNIFRPFIDAFKSAFGISSPSTEMEPLGGFVIEGMLEGIKAKLKNIKNWLKEHVFNPIVGGIKNLFGIHSPAKETKALGEDVSEGLKSGMQSKMGTTSKIKSWLKSNITGPIMDGIKGLFGIKNNKASETEAQGKALTEGLHSGIKAPWSSVETTLKNYSAKVVSTFKAKEGEMRTTGTNLMNQLKAGFTSGWSSAPSQLSNYASQITATFSGVAGNMNTIGGNLIIQLYYGMSTKISELSGHFASLAYSVANAMPSDKMQAAMETPGKWLGYGLYMGIYNYLTSHQSNFEALANWVARIFSNTLEVSSPSKVFARIGGFLMEGLSVGMDDEKKSVLQTTSGIASAITDEMETGEFSINSTMPRALDQFGDLIADKFTDLINRLESIAGRVTFAAPAMANGTVPYSVSAASMDRNGTDQKQDDDLSSVLIQVVNNAVTTLVRAIEENGGTVVNIDKSSLTQAVIEETNRITRMTGTSPLLV